MQMGPVGMRVKREGLTEKDQVPKSPTPFKAERGMGREPPRGQSHSH